MAMGSQVQIKKYVATNKMELNCAVIEQKVDSEAFAIPILTASVFII